MRSTEELSTRDMAEIADAAHGLGLHDASVILIEALYDRLDGKYVEDLSDVVELVRQATFTKPAAALLRYRQKKLLNIIFSVLLPFGALLAGTRYVASAAAVGAALITVAKSSVAHVLPLRLNVTSARYGDNGHRTDHILAHDLNEQLSAVPLPGDYIRPYQ